MAMYIVTFWTSVEIDCGLNYEYQEKMVLPECDMEELGSLDVVSVQLID